MKMLHILVLVAVCSCFSVYKLNAKTVITNNTPYEVKAIVEWAGGRGGWDSFPGDSVNKVNGVYNAKDNVNKGMMPGETHDTSKDWSDIKNHWQIWAKIDGAWKQVLSRNKNVTGGLIHPVSATITNRVDDNGDPVFDISIEQGW